VHAFLERLAKAMSRASRTLRRRHRLVGAGTVLPWAGRRSRRSEVPNSSGCSESACVRPRLESRWRRSIDVRMPSSSARITGCSKKGEALTPRGRAHPGRRRRIVRWPLLRTRGVEDACSTAEQAIQEPAGGDARHRPIHWAWWSRRSAYIAILGAAGFRSVRICCRGPTCS